MRPDPLRRCLERQRAYGQGYPCASPCRQRTPQARTRTAGVAIHSAVVGDPGPDRPRRCRRDRFGRGPSCRIQIGRSAWLRGRSAALRSGIVPRRDARRRYTGWERLVRRAEAPGSRRFHAGLTSSGRRDHKRNPAAATHSISAGCSQRFSLHGVPAAASLFARTDERPEQGDQVHERRCIPMRYLSTVYVRDHRARVKHRRGSLLVSSPEGSQRIPLEAIDAVVMLGSAQITTQALEACVRRGVRVTAMKMSGAVRFVVGASTGGNVHLRISLYRAVTDDEHSLALSKAIVAAKLQNSRKVVDRWARDEKDPAEARRLAARAAQISDRIPRLAGVDTADHVRGIEGDAARAYFGAVGQAVSKSDFSFSARTRRPPRDPVNAMLGFCYGLLVTEFIGAVEGVGLDYQMGFFHRPRSGRPSLALDLAEELRALTDRFVVSLIRRRQVGQDSFVRMPGGGVYMSDEGRTSLIKEWEAHKEAEIYHAISDRRIGRWALPSVQATLLARHLRGDLPAYPPFVMT